VSALIEATGFQIVFFILTIIARKFHGSKLLFAAYLRIANALARGRSLQTDCKETLHPPRQSRLDNRAIGEQDDEVHSRAFALSEHQGQKSWRAHGPHSTHIVCEDGDSAAISLLGAQPLEDLDGAIGMLLQPALDDWLVRIELALSPGSEVLAVGLLARPLCDRLFIGVQLTADLGKA
jgi:hypothetical protein